MSVKHLSDIYVDGKIGIGTESPGVDLQVSGKVTLGNSFTPTSTEHENLLNVIVGASDAGATNGIGFYENSGGFGMKLGYDGTGSGIDNQLSIYDNNDASVIHFTNGGRIGIGDFTNSYVQADLHIVDAGNSSSGIRIEAVGSAATDTVNMHFQGTAGTAPFYISRASTGGAEIQIQADGDLILNGNNGDNVGIGTTNPQQKLDVNGNTLLRGNVYFTSGTSNYYNGVGGGFSVYTQGSKQFEVDYNGYLEALKYGDAIYQGLGGNENLPRTIPGFSYNGRMVEVTRFYTTKIEPGGWPTSSGSSNGVSITPTPGSDVKMWIKNIWVYKHSNNTGSGWSTTTDGLEFVMQTSGSSYNIIGSIPTQLLTQTGSWYYKVNTPYIDENASGGVSASSLEPHGWIGRPLILILPSAISQGGQPTYYFTVEYMLIDQSTLKNNVDQTLT